MSVRPSPTVRPWSSSISVSTWASVRPFVSIRCKRSCPLWTSVSVHCERPCPSVRPLWTSVSVHIWPSTRVRPYRSVRPYPSVGVQPSVSVCPSVCNHPAVVYVRVRSPFHVGLPVRLSVRIDRVRPSDRPSVYVRVLPCRDGEDIGVVIRGDEEATCKYF